MTSTMSTRASSVCMNIVWIIDLTLTSTHRHQPPEACDATTVAFDYRRPWRHRQVVLACLAADPASRGPDLRPRRRPGPPDRCEPGLQQRHHLAHAGEPVAPVAAIASPMSASISRGQAAAAGTTAGPRSRPVRWRRGRAGGRPRRRRSNPCALHHLVEDRQHVRIASARCARRPRAADRGLRRRIVDNRAASRARIASPSFLGDPGLELMAAPR